jgi:hypothetical protein
MTRPMMGYLAGAAFVLSVASAATAYAQTTPPTPPAPGEHAHGQRVEREIVIRDDDGDEHGAMRHGGEHHMMMMRHEGADHAEHLRTMLQLKPSQDAALKAYLAATAPPHHERVVEMSDHGAPKTTPQRLTEMEAHMAEQAAQAHTRIEATRKFYDQLEPSQKKVFDEMPMMMMGPMGPMMHGGGMKMMVRMDGMPPMPPMPPMPAHPPRAPAPPAPHS